VNLLLNKQTAELEHFGTSFFFSPAAARKMAIVPDYPIRATEFTISRGQNTGVYISATR
jgi:hypothetical protein